MDISVVSCDAMELLKIKMSWVFYYHLQNLHSTVESLPFVFF